MEADWDLHAVVRGCATIASTSSTTTTTTTTTTSSSVSSSSSLGTSYQPATPSSCGFFYILPGSEQSQSGQAISLCGNPFEARSTVEELHELRKPLFLKSQPFHPFQASSSPLSSSFSYSSSSPNSGQAQQKQQQQQHSKNPHHAGSATTTPRSKRRKNQLKKVCQVPAENLSSDIWAWRKYGQKPIKGSPYPRGYYRCSSSKGCLARKQVERSRSDPTMFIVTYTGEHNHPAPTHRNSLAGSTRQKPQTPQMATTGDTEKALIKPVSPSTSGVEEEGALVAKSESEEDMEDLMNDDDGVEENEFGSPDMGLTDDFFEGLDELTGSAAVTGDSCFVDPFKTSVAALPALVANSAATAASGS